MPFISEVEGEKAEKGEEVSGGGGGGGRGDDPQDS